MRIGLFSGVVCLLIGITCARADDLTPQQTLDEAESQFRQQQYRRVVGLLQPLMYPEPRITNVDDQHRVRELLGASWWFLDEKDKAGQEFQLLLLKHPAFVLDAFIYPRDLRQFLEAIRERLVKQGYIPPLADLSKPKEPEEKPPTVLRVREIYASHSRASAFMPFGLAQFEYGEDGWGAFFASTQGVSYLGHLATGITYLAMFNNDTVSQSTKEGLFIGTIATLGAAALFYAWGVIDGNLRHEPMRVISISQPEPMDAKEAADALRPPQPQLGEPPIALPSPTAPGGSPQ